MERNLEDKSSDILVVKLKCERRTIENNAEDKRLSRLSSKLDSEESVLRQVKRSIDSENLRLERRRREVETKATIAIQKANESSDKIREYFSIKREVEASRVVVEQAEADLNKKTEILLEDRKEVEKDKEFNTNERKKLSEWDDRLKRLEADLKDLRRLNSVEDRELKNKISILQKLRKAKKEE